MFVLRNTRGKQNPHSSRRSHDIWKIYWIVCLYVANPSQIFSKQFILSKRQRRHIYVCLASGMSDARLLGII